MESNKERLNHFGVYRTPTPNEVGYKAFLDFQNQNLKKNPGLKRKIEEKGFKALSVGRTQDKNGVGFLQDKELRYFHHEYNSRAWNYGFGSMPPSFNIIEGFFKWNTELFYFGLLDEEEHLFSLFDYFDFITSKDCSNSLDYFIDNVKDELIYNYNILNEVNDLTYSITDSKEYVIGGISFVKRGNEVFICLIAGEISNVNERSQELCDMEQIEIQKPYLKPSNDYNLEAVKLFGRNDIWKVNLYARIDLQKKTIDSRYIQKDSGKYFITFTDDYGTFDTLKDNKTIEEMIKIQTEELNKYNAIFEIAYNLLFLPEYFDFYNEFLVHEEHPTGLFNETLRKHLTKKQREIIPEYDPKYFFKTKDVWVLDRKSSNLDDKSHLKKTDLKIEKDGYWKYLEPGKFGTDKNGKPIHNRTWVEKTLTWHESLSPEIDIKINIPEKASQNHGFIYMMRNPAHELDLFKIGLTTKTVEERAKQLSGTASPDKFLIINRWETKDCILAEKLIHKKLEKHRINPKREFFKISIEIANKEISQIIEEINNSQKR